MIRARLIWIPLCLVVLTGVTGCGSLRGQLTPAELSERLRYGPDQTLEELVKIALSTGYHAANGAGPPRRVLELSSSESGAIHRKFFEVQPWGEGYYEVFFLENRGSVRDTELGGFPRRIRKAVREFLQGIDEQERGQYKPLLISQEKMTKHMMLYESGNHEAVMEFTEKIALLEKSRLYGLLSLPDGPFFFLGHEPEQVSRRDFLEADVRFQENIQEFVETFRAGWDL